MIRRHPVLVVFVGAYMGVFAALAVRAGNREFVFYGVVMLLLIAALWRMHARVRFSTPVLWGLALWGFLHMAGGNVPVPDPASPGGATVLYNFRPSPLLPKYDQAVHAYGFFVATLASFEALRAAAPGLRVGLGIATASVCMGMGLGAANEVVEFIATLTLPETNVGGYANTGWDLVSNGAGAVAAGVLILVTGGTPPPPRRPARRSFVSTR